MKLCLHIGTEKTGSSFLQTVLARTRQQLILQQVHYPTAGKREQDMLAGRISPGNARELARALKKQEWPIVQAILSQSKFSAKGQAENVLLSNENLVEALSKRAVLENFLKICYELGFEEVKMLLVLRDPVDHVISLYKHRAKFGNAGSASDWLQRGYQLPEQLNNFLSTIDDFPSVNLSVRKYSKDGRALTQLFFQEWLKVDFPAIWKDDSVNPSLTLSELELIRAVHGRQPNMVQPLYNILLALPVAKKSSDEFIQSQINEQLTNELSKFSRVWELCNRFLPVRESLSIPVSKKEIETARVAYSFSSEQIMLLAKFWKETRSPSFFIKNQLRYLLALMKSLKTKIYK